MVFYYHKTPALDAGGGGGPATGLAAIRRAGVTHQGWSMDSDGQFPNRNAVQDIQFAGANIIRTSETRFDPGRPDNFWNRVNFGKILMDFHSIQRPGPFIEAWRAAFKAPATGVAFDAEYGILTSPEWYPLRTEDFSVARTWGYGYQELLAKSPRYVEFRCRQVATVLRLLYLAARTKTMHSGTRIEKAIVFSGYPHLQWSPFGSVQETYACDWEMMQKPLSWRGTALPPVTHAMCPWNTDVVLPDAAREWVRTTALSVLHVLQLSPTLACDAGGNWLWDNWRAQINDRFSILRPGDGIGLVNLLDKKFMVDGQERKEGKNAPHVFSQADATLLQIFGEEMRARGFIKDPDAGF